MSLCKVSFSSFSNARLLSSILKENRRNVKKQPLRNVCTTRRRGVVVITTAELHSTKPELRFCAGSNPVRGVSEIRNGEDL